MILFTTAKLWLAVSFSLVCSTSASMVAGPSLNASPEISHVDEHRVVCYSNCPRCAGVVERASSRMKRCYHDWTLSTAPKMLVKTAVSLVQSSAVHTRVHTSTSCSFQGSFILIMGYWALPCHCGIDNHNTLHSVYCRLVLRGQTKYYYYYL